MTLKKLIAEANEVFAEKWQVRKGLTIPDPEDIKLSNDAVALTGTVLYADMADSTDLVNDYKAPFAAEIYKTYLLGACRIIRAHGGEITAFDGDRVMAVYFDNSPNSSAAKSALKMQAYVDALNVAIKQSYPTTSFSLRHHIGIDSSELFVARTGIRNSNDLVWVGRAANFAAKLCSLGDSTFHTHITEAVFTKLSDESKYGGEPRELMWEKRNWSQMGIVVYRSSWNWKF
jgi:class 3 adenylate cyclase